MSPEISALLADAQQLHQQGKLAQAIEQYEQIIALVPQNADALQGLGICAAQLNHMEKAIDYFNRAIEQNPDNHSLHNNIANAYKALGNLDKAIQHYQDALRINPHYAAAHNNIATVFALQNNYREALNHYRLAVHAEPDFVAAHYNLGLLLLKQGESDAAAVQFKNVQTLNPNQIEAHFYSGVLHLRANRFEEAEHDFQQVLALNPEHVDTLVNIGVIAIKRSQEQLAVDYFTKALSLDEDNMDARNNLAALFIHHDRYENAFIHYDFLLKKDPVNIEYLYNAGVAQMALGHLQEARIHFETILNRQEKHFATLNNLAAIHSRLGQREEAIQLLKRAIAVNPNDSSCQFMLNALTGENNQRPACPDYIHNLFDQYALYYEQHMQGALQYALPHHIGRLLHQFHGINKVERALDLGCGTGLMGVVMREISMHLTGVDLSAKMLAIAREKTIYDTLIESELIHFLQQDTHTYSLAIAADVIPYFGELETLFGLIRKRLSDQGLFILTTEISADEPWQLQRSARFNHHERYIQSLCVQHHLELIHQEKVIARMQNQLPLNVMIYVCRA